MQTSKTEISIIARPSDANSIGTVFGGRIMELMDMAAAICARRHSRLQVVTYKVSDMNFIKPIRIGNVMKIEAFVTRTFHTSMEVAVNVFAEDTYKNGIFLAANGFFNIVTMNEDNEPAKMPQFIPRTEEEKMRWEEAGQRRKVHQARGASQE